MKVKYSLYIIAIFLMIIFILFSLKHEKSGKLNLINNSKYTIGIITSNWHNKSTTKNFGVDYKYNIQNIQYENQISRDLKLNNKYLLVYDSSNISNLSELLLIYPLPDSLEAPINGWKYNEVPISIDSVKIRKYVLNED